MSKVKKRLVNYERKRGSGFVCMHRGWMDHPVFGREPLTNREIWAWLIEEATFSYDGREIAFKGTQFMLKRGQLAFSHSFMAEAWGCPKSRVGRVLDKFRKFQMIETFSGTDATIITICNYEEKQIDYRKNETILETETRQEKNRNRTNYNNGNTDKNGKAKGKSLRAGAHALPLLVDVLGAEGAKKLKASFEPHIYNAWIEGLFYKEGIILCKNSSIRDKCKNDYSSQIINACKLAKVDFREFGILS